MLGGGVGRKPHFKVELKNALQIMDGSSQY